MNHNESAVSTAVKPARNYEIDVLKLVFTVFILFTHTMNFLDDTVSLNIAWLSNLGWVSVHFFFMVSGLLMVNSYMKKGDIAPADCGKESLSFVLRKFKSLALPYFLTMLISFGFHVYYYRFAPEKIGKLAINIFPELFGVTEAGFAGSELNAPLTWYVSALLITMLPLYYMLCRNKKAFLYAFSPFVAIVSMGYLYNTKPNINRSNFNGLCYDGLIRALCGLTFGVIAWLISDRLTRTRLKKAGKVTLTVLEAALYAVFFAVFLHDPSESALVYPVMLLLPIALGITFSRQSYISALFEFKWMRYIGGFSLAIFMVHDIAGKYVKLVLTEGTYWERVGKMAVLTAALAVLLTLLKKLVKLVWEKKLKAVFSNEKKLPEGGAANG